MTIDFSGNGSVFDDAMTFPDWSFPDIPLQASEIKETTSICGSSTTSTAIGGEVDHVEQVRFPC